MPLLRFAQTFSRSKQPYRTRILLKLWNSIKPPFLHNFSIPDSDLFEDWLTTVREKMQRQAQEAFGKLAQVREEQGNYEQAIRIARQLLELAPWQEEAHQQLMRLLALSGQRSAALAQYDTLCQMLMDELGVPPAPETDTLYDQILAGDAAPESSSSAVKSQVLMVASPFQATAPPPHFVGRDGEVEQLRMGMVQPGLQVHAIVGMGGVGKSALATQVAHTLRSDFPDGVLWGNPATSASLDILAAWSGAYGYDFSQMSDIESRAAAVRGMMAEKRALLVVDNVNQLADVQPLLPSGEGCAVLLTTRDLDVAHALNADAMLLGELAAEKALELLEETIGIDRVQREAEAAREICRVLSNLPLAVELAAQRLKSRPRMKLAQMAERLGDQQQRLGLGISDRAVRASFEVSWGTLDEELQAVFPLLAVFEGRSFTTEAVAGVASPGFAAETAARPSPLVERGDDNLLVDEKPGIENIAVSPSTAASFEQRSVQESGEGRDAALGQQSRERLDIEDALFALEALSLVRAEGDNRWWQHTLLADFAREKLADVVGAYANFSDYFYHFALENAEAFEQLDPEWENSMAAMQAAYTQRRWSTVVAFAEALQEPWSIRARYTDARRGFAWVHEAANQLGDTEAVAENLQRWGEACLEQNAYTEAIEHLNQSLAWYRSQEDDMGIASTQDLLARIAIEGNGYVAATTLLDENLSLYSQAQNHSGIASVYFQKARIEYASAQWQQAKDAAEEALAIQMKMQDLLGQIRTTRLLAQIHLIQEELAEAYRYCQRAQALSEESHNASELAITLYTLTAILHRREALDAAQNAAEQSLRLLRRMGELRTEGMLLSQLSEIERSRGNNEIALELVEESVKLARSFDDRVTLAHALVRLSDQYAEMGNQELSRQSLDEVQAIAEQLGNGSLKKYVQQRVSST